VFSLSVSGIEGSNNTHCFQLAEVVSATMLTPVVGSETCTSLATSDQRFTLKSAQFGLPSGDRT